MKILLISFLVISSIFAQTLDFRQILTLKTVKNIALEYPTKNGETLENTAMAICMAETSGGKVRWGDKQLLKKGIKNASYGVMQVRLQTARFVAKIYDLKDIKNMSDTTLITKMMNEIVFNAKIAVLYLVWLRDTSKSYFEAVSRYNGGRVNYPYYNKVQKYIKMLKKHNL